MAIIITGASSNHYKSLCQCVKSIQTYCPQIDLVVWDLGLTSSEHISFQIEFQIALRLFDYSKYPSFYDISRNAGQYAWKSAAIQETIGNRNEGIVLWLDAGCKINGSLIPLFNHIKAEGLYSNPTSGSIRQYIHPQTMMSLNKRYEDFRSKSMRNGGIIGFNLGIPRIVKWFNTWRALCDNESIIAPAGSDRSNHRQDQAILTITFWDLFKLHRFNTVSEFYEIQMHCDIP